MRVSQPTATPSDALFITRNEQVSGSSSLVGSLFSPGLQVKYATRAREVASSSFYNFLRLFARRLVGISTAETKQDEVNL